MKWACRALLRVSSGTILPIFIEIDSYLTEKEQKISWHSFLRHGVVLAYDYEMPFLSVNTDFYGVCVVGQLGLLQFFFRFWT